MIQSTPLSRRTLLRGAGVAIALPLLEAMVPTTFAAQKANAPKRLAFLYVPNGIIHSAWKPVSTGTAYELPSSLEPLRTVKDDVVVVTGLSQIPYPEKSGVGHARPTTALLTGSVADKEAVRAGKSLDQIVAEAVGKQTRFPSLQLSIANTVLNGRCDSGFSCAYSSCISWRNATSPMPNDNDPRRVFQRLFGKATTSADPAKRTKQQAIRKSVLDSVLEDAQQLSRQLGKADQRKLDEYLYSVRQLERRVDAVPPSNADATPPMPQAKPTDYAEHVRLMGDLMVAAFQTDATRVCTFMLGVAASEQTYPMLGIREGHHELSHKNTQEDAIAKLRKIDRYNVSLYSYIVGRMKAIREGEGTLLDNSIVFYGSGLGNGGAHTPFDLPVLLTGGAGTWKPGRHVACPLDTPLNNLWLNVADAMGVRLERFGNSTGRVRNL